MLKPSECLAGPVSLARGMTLVIPRSGYEQLVLIVDSEDKTHMVALDKEGRMPFMSFECEGNDRWAGLHIPGVSIELDESALTDIDGYYAPAGSMVRKDDGLSICVSPNGQAFGRAGILLPILTGLPPCAERSSACFLRWQIVLGDGDAKRVLHVVDVSANAPPVN